MRLKDLRVNHVTEPLGLAIERPVFSWVAEDTESKKQAAAQITVTAGGETLYDSGRREDISSLGFEAPLDLKPRTRYRWSVTVWGDQGDWAAASSWFETAKEGEPWQGKWIAADFADKEAQPLLTKDFTLGAEPVSARLYACGLGIYEAEVNGKKAGDEYLLPGYHCYDFALEYQTFDVTTLLHKGDNTLGFALGPGWYKGDMIFDRYHDLYGDTMQLICELHVTLADGTQQVVCSDGSWKSYPSPVTFSNIYDGEHRDANREVLGWSCPGCGAQAGGVVLREEATPLVARRGLRPEHDRLGGVRGKRARGAGGCPHVWGGAPGRVLLPGQPAHRQGGVPVPLRRAARLGAAPVHLLRLPLCEGGGRD